MKLVLILTSVLMLSFAALASDKIIAAKKLITQAITNSFSIADYEDLRIIEISLDTVEISSLDCGNDLDGSNTFCIVTATEETEAKFNVRGFYFFINTESNLITKLGVVPAEKRN